MEIRRECKKLRLVAIEQAIGCYEQALAVTTRDALSVEWTQTMNNLAAAYYSRIRGDRNVLHLACHGTANLTEPLTSGLLMHDGLLSLRDLLDLKLADEAISLPTGLLQAGVAGVIASLWSVSNLSTMILLTRFYDLWRTDGLPMDQALRQAQQWLRDTPEGEIADYLGLVTLTPNDRTYTHPFHWATFSYTGV